MDSNVHIPPRTTANGKPTGAVLVVGGGIAGMQTSLDLADQGFKVYLVEKESAIGGKMAQLDKTFPTNDCAMCTISPKLVETGRHPNIEILTETEVLAVDGNAGHFQARLHTRPRYVDKDKCIACNACIEVCPVVLPDPFNEGLSQRRAIYKRYPQSVPNAFAIEKQGIAPCRDACPAGQRAQGYIALIREQRWNDAMRVIKMDNPFPGICGRICNHRCETACNRGILDDPVNIRALKRFVTDKVYENARTPLEPAEIIYPDQRIAVIGAGPCGLTAAQDLVMTGFPVTVFEAMPVAGGMLRLGVPEYRLPTEIVEREVQDILDLGVDLRLNHRVDDLDVLFDQGFAAVLIAVGAHEGVRLPIPGADLDGVIINTHFLRDVRLGKYSQNGDPIVGKRVLVLGGGNVAVDCARTALRLREEIQVELACLESKESMPAHDWEVHGAEEEGVLMHTGVTFERILGDETGRVAGVECARAASFSFDETGRLHIEKVPGSTHVIPCDTVIFSVGQKAGLAFIPDDAGVGLTRQNTIAVNPNTFATSRPGVFAAGDSVTGTAFVIEAVANGHKAAASIIRYLKGQPVEPTPGPELPVVHFSKDDVRRRVERGELRIHRRIPMQELPLTRRSLNFAEIEIGYDDAGAQAEASRCLACGVCSECMSCVFVCGVNAIDHTMVGRDEVINIGAVVLAPGYQAYQAELSEEFGFGRYPNVVTALQFERMLSASGPSFGQIRRPSDENTPKRIAFLQCVGSRDQSHDYCSAVCCMFATKEAMIAKEHHPGLEVDVFFMDIRAFSKGYWQYFERSKTQFGVRYHRSRISSLKEDIESNDLLLRYYDEGGSLRESRFDMVVLSVGMEISRPVKALAERLGIELDPYGFCHTPHFNPVETSRRGIFAVGPFREPKDIPDSVVEAGGAAASAAGLLSESRFSLTSSVEYPEERDIKGEAPRIGVFVCHCGSNIGGFLDVPQATEFAARLPGVVHAENNLYTCSQDNIRHISQVIEEQRLNRVVVASCTPLTHAPLFQDSLRNAGLNPYLFEMANIRNQCSWVHSHDWDAATSKARELIHMAVGRASQLEPQYTIDVPVRKAGLVIGGGAAGMTAAVALAEQGFVAHLVEKSDKLGGNLRHVFTNSEPAKPGAQEILTTLVAETMSNPMIHVHLNARVVETGGYTGNFTSVIAFASGVPETIEHGATILATGGKEYTGPEYDFGKDARVITQLEIETHIHENLEADLPLPKNVVMIQCVGPAKDFCSRICCTVAIKNALALRAANPGSQVTILYKDIRTYGFKERLYTQAREAGVLFVRYTDDHPPKIVSNEPLIIRAWEAGLNREIELPADVLVLSMPVVPHPETKDLAKKFKVSLDSMGFFQEAHAKLRPVDFSTEGVFMAGTAHYPKLIEETLVQARAAAARAVRILSRETLTAGGRIAVVDEGRCTACLTCVRICPFDVPKIMANLTGAGGIPGAAYIQPAICQGCGICAAECPAKAIQLRHYTDLQMESKVAALMSPREIPVLN